MNILEINPADFGGGIGHVAAAQLHEFFMQDQEDGAAAPFWFGQSDGDIAENVLAMARYVNGRNISGEQLWRWATIEGIVDTGLTSFDELPLHTRLGFEIFVSVGARAHDLIEIAQIEAKKAEVAEAVGQAAPTLKLEDSIFEPSGSLADQDAYQKQFLEDQQKIDADRLAAIEEAASDAVAYGVGAVMVSDDGNVARIEPESMSVGQQEEQTDETPAADQGPETGSEAAPDTGAQGDVSDLADDGDPDAGDEDAGRDEGDQEGDAAPQAEAVAAPLADADAKDADGNGSGDVGGSDDAAQTESAGAAETGNHVSGGAGSDTQPEQDAGQSADQGSAEGDGSGASQAAEQGKAVAEDAPAPVKRKKKTRSKSAS